MMWVVTKTQCNIYFAFIIQVGLPGMLEWHFSNVQIIVSFLHIYWQIMLLCMFSFSSYFQSKITVIAVQKEVFHCDQGKNSFSCSLFKDKYKYTLRLHFWEKYKHLHSKIKKLWHLCSGTTGVNWFVRIVLFYCSVLACKSSDIIFLWSSDSWYQPNSTLLLRLNKNDFEGSYIW